MKFMDTLSVIQGVGMFCGNLRFSYESWIGTNFASLEKHTWGQIQTQSDLHFCYLLVAVTQSHVLKTISV